MIIMQSLVSLFLLLTFFSIMGLGITKTSTAKYNLALVPIFGYAAVIGLAYILSANLKITGADAVGSAILILLFIFIIRIRHFSGLLKNTLQNNQLSTFLAAVIIPIISLILPALLIGFKYFYADVNYDFFYDSQDSWFLQTHNVLQFSDITQLFEMNKAPITPLSWSANFAGRVGINLFGSFFSKWFHWDILHFNSALLNVLVILFSLSISAFCKEFFNLSKKATLLAILFSVMSAGYAQAYCYYILGQISVAPVFVVFCIYLKRFLDSVAEKNSAKNLTAYMLILGLLLNILFILYAIISFFAGALAVLSYLILFRTQLKNSISHLIKMILMSVGMFCIVRLSTIPETIHILSSWISLSNHVAEGIHKDVFIVFSEYLTSSFLSLFFGLATYPSIYSIFNISVIAPYRIAVLIGFGFGALIITLLALKSYANSNENSKAARVIMISLLSITLLSASYFFFALSGYGIFKLQSWFLPLLIPLYIYSFNKLNPNKLQYMVKIGCALILGLNFYTGTKYLKDFFVPGNEQRFVNAHGITGNKEVFKIANQLKFLNPAEISLFLTNGLETAWFANSLRAFSLNTVIHNSQPLQEKDPNESPCSAQDNTHWHPTGLLITTNPNSSLYEITEPPQGGKIIYETTNYRIIDPSNLETFVYLGAGSYPIEYFLGNDTAFPAKFRWVEKSAEVVVYSNKDKQANLMIEVTPGYVDNQNRPRTIIIKTANDEHQYSIQSKKTVIIPNISLHQGLNCVVVSSPDKVTRLTDKAAWVHPNIPLEARLTNFAISKVSLSPHNNS